MYSVQHRHQLVQPNTAPPIMSVEEELLPAVNERWDGAAPSNGIRPLSCVLIWFLQRHPHLRPFSLRYILIYLRSFIGSLF